MSLGTETALFDSLTADPGSPETGELWFRSDLQVFRFYDGATTITLGGSGISEAQHKALRDLIHFIDDGPADGFASGAFKENTYTGIRLTSSIWYTDIAKASKIVETNYTYTGIRITSAEWKMYDTDGSTVLVTLTDAYAYSGIRLISKTRTWV